MISRSSASGQVPDKIRRELHPLQSPLRGSIQRGKCVREFRGGAVQGFELLAAKKADTLRGGWVQGLECPEVMPQSPKPLFGYSQAALADSSQHRPRVVAAKLVGLLD